VYKHDNQYQMDSERHSGESDDHFEYEDGQRQSGLAELQQEGWTKVQQVQQQVQSIADCLDTPDRLEQTTNTLNSSNARQMLVKHSVTREKEKQVCVQDSSDLQRILRDPLTPSQKDERSKLKQSQQIDRINNLSNQE